MYAKVRGLGGKAQAFKRLRGLWAPGNSCPKPRLSVARQWSS